MSHKTIDQAIKDVSERYQNYLKEDTKRIESNFQACALLEGAGFDLKLQDWESMIYIDLDLKDMDELRKVRETLDCPLVLDNKTIGDARKRLVRLNFKPRDYPGLTVSVNKKIPKGSKCKIVCTTEYSRRRRLVCDS